MAELLRMMATIKDKVERLLSSGGFEVRQDEQGA